AHHERPEPSFTRASVSNSTRRLLFGHRATPWGGRPPVPTDSDKLSAHSMVDLSSLHQRLDPVGVLDAILGALRESVVAHGVGLAQSEEDSADWEVVGYRQVDQQRPQQSGRFAIDGTAGEWACRYEQPFVGRQRRDVAPFPGTVEPRCTSCRARTTPFYRPTCRS
ncbi:MAG: hypothetical protein AAFZ65_02940, partial [Planctomycetota bacterium]